MNSVFWNLEKSTINIHADLITKCRSGDQIAQYEIYKLYSRAMFNTALRITANYEDAQDVLQEAFINAFLNLSAFRGDAPFGSWLKRIVINKAISHLKKNRLETRLETPLADAMREAEEGKSYTRDEKDTDEKLSVEAIKVAVTRLPAGFRSVLTLYLFEGYDHKEIAEIMNISESTSKTQYKRAKEKLKDILKVEVKYG